VAARLVRQYHAIAPHALAQQAEPRWRSLLTVAGMAERGPRPVAPLTLARQRCLARRAGATRQVTFWPDRSISFLSLSYSRSPIPAHEPARRRRLATVPKPPPPRHRAPPSPVTLSLPLPLHLPPFLRRPWRNRARPIRLAAALLSRRGGAADRLPITCEWTSQLCGVQYTTRLNFVSLIS
jgi:hypothetical protein